MSVSPKKYSSINNHCSLKQHFDIDYFKSFQFHNSFDGLNLKCSNSAINYPKLNMCLLVITPTRIYMLETNIVCTCCQLLFKSISV